MRLSPRPSFLAPLAAVALLSAGCADEETGAAAAAQTCGPGKTQTFVVSTLAFTRVDAETGRAPGFDLDGVISDGNDEGSCFKKDFTSPEGQEGIDNQIATFVPELEAILGDAVDGLVQGAINNGELLIMLQVDGVQDLQNDECVDLRVSLGEGTPSLGTTGIIEAYQTFDPDPSGEVSVGRRGKIEGGELTIGPFDLAVPIAIFDVAFTMHVYDAYLRLTVDAEDGTLKGGHLGGGIIPQEVLDGVKDGGGVAQYLPILSVVLNQSTDLAPDAEGTCQQVSVALQLSAVEAFLRE